MDEFLFVDVYKRDLNGMPDWNVLANTQGYYGAILKAHEGITYNDNGWFERNWRALREVAEDRYGDSWFRGAYLFLKFLKDGEEQADAYLRKIENAGGWDFGDIIPIIDVELGNDGSNGRPRNPNRDASKQQVIDCTTACAERLRSETGRDIMLYGRGAMRDLDIVDRMGCNVVWNPSYTRTMVRNGLEAWDLKDIVLWQYCGDGTAAIETLPHSIDNFGEVDISVYIDGGNSPTIESLRRRLGIRTVS
jgi:GH25 family lysozyme M1 (1,4-beta-N-acetylmuramidase)